MIRAFLISLLITTIALSLVATAVATEQAANSAQVQRITLYVTDLDVGDFFRLIANVSGLSVVAAPNIHGRVTAILNDVPWPQALDAVLKSNGLTAIRNGDVITIMTIAEAKQFERTSPTQICTYRLDWARADEVAPLLQPFLSPQGRIAADVRTNTLIVRDRPQVLESVGLSPVPAGRGRCFGP